MGQTNLLSYHSQVETGLYAPSYHRSLTRNGLTLVTLDVELNRAERNVDRHGFLPTLAAAISIKLPPFWPADLDPKVWLAQVEFTTRGITTQKTKFDYVISSLGPEFATEVRDLLLKRPAEQPYDKLRAQRIRRTASSEQRKLQQLISNDEL